MSKLVIGILIVVVVIILFVLIFFGSVVGVYNTLNRNYQTVGGAKSQYSAALNVCTEKIKGVWEIANQYMAHESATFKAVAEARSGYQAAADAYKKAIEEGKGVKELTEAGTGVVQAALAFRIQVEAYPQLRAAETAKENMRNMEEATNEIKTALDDWIASIKSYNIYRGNFWPGIIGSFFGKFPSEIAYYEGEVKKLDIDQLNPQKK